MTKRNSRNKSVIKNHPAATAGAMIGAGVAVVAAKILSNKKTRRKVVNTIADVKDQILSNIENIEVEKKVPPALLGKVSGKNTRRKTASLARKTSKKKRSSAGI